MSPTAGGTVNWEPPAFSPETGLVYVSERNIYSIFYLTEPDPRGSMGLGGKDEVTVGTGGSFLTAIDYRNGKIVWRHRYPMGNGGGGGILATAGKLVFAGDAGGNIVAHDARHRQAAVALAHRLGDEPADHLQTRRPSARAGRRGRHAVFVRAEYP